MRIGEVRYKRLRRAILYREKCILINGIKTIVILPEGMKPSELPNRLNSKTQLKEAQEG